MPSHWRTHGAKAEAARKLAARKIDPIEQRKEERRPVRPKSVLKSSMTFKEAGETYRSTHESGWKNDKHKQHWQSTLETYAYPIFGDLPLEAITVGLARLPDVCTAGAAARAGSATAPA